MKRALFALCFLLSAYSLPLSAQSLTASWALNTEDDLAGYILYYGTDSGNYQHEIDTPDTTVHLDSLQIGVTYYVIVKAYDESGNISEPSNEVSATVQGSTATDMDYNNDGIVDPDDAPYIRLHYGRIVTDDNGLHIYDLNNDDFIDPDDVAVLRTHYGELQ